MIFILYFLIMIVLCEIIEYDRSKYHLIIIFGGLVSMIPTLGTIVDGSTYYSMPVLMGTIILCGNRIRIAARYKQGSDPDEDL